MDGATGMGLGSRAFEGLLGVIAAGSAGRWLGDRPRRQTVVQELATTTIATKIKGLAVANRAKSGAFVNRHSTDWVHSHT
jgi:hypothetical protein